MQKLTNIIREEKMFLTYIQVVFRQNIYFGKLLLSVFIYAVYGCIDFFHCITSQVFVQKNEQFVV